MLLLSLGLSNVGPYTHSKSVYEAKSNGSWAGLNPTQERLLSAAWNESCSTNYESIDYSSKIATTTNWTDIGSLHRLKIDWFKTGHEYDNNGITVHLSIAVLIIYNILTISYLLWTFITGRTSGSWDSIGELLMLALNSKRPTFLGRTSAGVENLNTYRQEVSVMVNELDECLELVFADDPDVDKTMYRNVEENKAY